VPFHTLSQLGSAFSLIEPLLDRPGITVTDIERTWSGLAEFRNGGLFFTVSGVLLELRDPLVAALLRTRDSRCR
jgi:hypothetical protein